MARPIFGGLAPLPVMPGCLPCVRQSQMQMCISTFQVPFRDQTSFLPLDRQPTAARGGGGAAIEPVGSQTDDAGAVFGSVLVGPIAAWNLGFLLSFRDQRIIS